MEALIKQAFQRIDLLGPHVQEGHYDLLGPNGAIIPPSVWEEVIEPGWDIVMTMWPLDKTPLAGPEINERPYNEEKSRESINPVHNSGNSKVWFSSSHGCVDHILFTKY